MEEGAGGCPGLRGPAGAGPGRAARPGVRARPRPRTLPLPADRRVPGHGPAAGRDRGAAGRRRAGPAGGGRRRQAVDLPLPAGGRGAVRAAGGGGAHAARPRGAPAAPELPVAAVGAVVREPRLRAPHHVLGGRGPAGVRAHRPAAGPPRRAGRAGAALPHPGADGERPGPAGRRGGRGGGAHRARGGGRLGRARSGHRADAPEPRGRRDGAGAPAHAGALPGGRARPAGRRLRGGRRQVLLQPPGGPRGARDAACDRRPVGSGEPGGRAALVVLRRERPRPRRAPPGGTPARDRARGSRGVPKPVLRAGLLGRAARGAAARERARPDRAPLRPPRGCWPG